MFIFDNKKENYELFDYITQFGFPTGLDICLFYKNEAQNESPAESSSAFLGNIDESNCYIVELATFLKSYQ